MGTMFNLLEQYRLESYYDPFLQLGVKDLRDLLDGVTDEDLINLGKMLNMEECRHPKLTILTMYMMLA